MSELSAQLSELNTQVSSKRQSLLDQIEKEEREKQLSLIEEDSKSDANESSSASLSPELLKLLFASRCEHEAVQSFMSKEQVDAALERLEKFQVIRAELDRSYPNTLLGVDLMRKAEALKAKINELTVEQWNRQVQMTDTSLAFKTLNDYSLSKASINYGSADLLSKFEKNVIEPLLHLKIDLEVRNEKLCWSPKHIEMQNESGVASLVKNVQTLADYIANSPKPLNTDIPRRFGAHIILQSQLTSLPKSFPDTANPRDFQIELQKLLPPLENDYLKPHWTKGSESVQLADDINTMWPEVRQEHYLTRLRKIYQEPVTEESRTHIVTWYEDSHIEAIQEVGNDDWEWNDDDDDNEDTSTHTNLAGVGVDTGESSSASKGNLIDLWLQYTTESLPQSSFYTSYRALVTVAYGDHDLWIYEDTSKFLSHIRVDAASSPNQEVAATNVEQLVKLCDEHLDRYVKSESSTFENTLLPALFSPTQSKEAVKKILSAVDSLAMTVNSVGGPDLRQSVLSQIVERIAVSIIATIEQLPDIGENESQDLAILIARSDPLGIYFDQIAESVPSWTKLEILQSILTGSLASIEEMLDQHKLLDFSPEELASSLCALFQDSTERRRLIMRSNNTVM